MHTEDDVKALAEKMGEAKLGPPRGTKILASALMYQGDLEALARVALEWVEEREAPELKHWGEADSIYDETEEPK